MEQRRITLNANPILLENDRQYAKQQDLRERVAYHAALSTEVVYSGRPTVWDIEVEWYRRMVSLPISALEELLDRLDEAEYTADSTYTDN